MSEEVSVAFSALYVLMAMFVGFEISRMRCPTSIALDYRIQNPCTHIKVSVWN
jgi:hypothetical protein